MTAPDEFSLGAAHQCLSEQALSSVRQKKAQFVRMRHSDIAGAVTVRKFYPTVAKGRCLLADVITGTLYDAMSGRCLSSSQNRLVVATAQPIAAAKPKRARKDTAAREHEGWMNEARRAAA